MENDHFNCVSDGDEKRVLILGGGFAGLYAALEFEKKLPRDSKVRVTLVNKDNFFLFTPMLHEVAASDLDMTHIVNPVRKLLKKVQFFVGSVENIDLTKKEVTVSHGYDHHTHLLGYDHVVIALGSVTNFFGLPGLQENALTMKSLGDAIALRNRIIQHLEEADTECAAKDREALLTFVVAGGGFAGVETMAAINDFVRGSLRFYPNLREEMLRMILVHPGEVLLPELDRKLGVYTEKRLSKRHVEIRSGTRVTQAAEGTVTLDTNEVIKTKTLIWTAGVAANPILAQLPCRSERGRLFADEYLQVPEWTGVWVVGDAALIRHLKTGEFHPPTAQHAQREGTTVAQNILSDLCDGKPAKKPFTFSTLGQLATIGRRTAVANILGINFSGFVAWWLWRMIYLSKLPRLEKKVRVAFDWTLDLMFSKDLVQFMTARSSAVTNTRTE
jgi:NADH dehydrogenase